MMSKHEFKFNDTVAVNLDPTSNLHTMRELTEQGLKLQTLSNSIRQATNTMAEHYHAIALGIERAARNKAGSKFIAKGDKGTDAFATGCEKDAGAIREALAVFRSQVGQEILYLQQHKGWDKDRLPSACDSAIRKIYKAWENGFSLEVLGTCSKLGKANSDKEKEVDAAIVSSAAQEQQQQQVDAQLTGFDNIDVALRELIQQAKAVAMTDSKTALQMIEGYATRLANVAAQAAVSLAAAS